MLLGFGYGVFIRLFVGHKNVCMVFKIVVKIIYLL